MPGSILGNAVRRVEDPELLAGRATYVGDLRVEGMLHVQFVRSPVAHAAVTSIDTSAASAMPGVVAVYTAADLDLQPMSAMFELHPACARPPLAADRVRFVGDIVAAVVAETPAQAEDAIEAVEVDVDSLPAVVDAEPAVAPGAPVLFDELGSNLIGGLRDDDDPLGDANVVVRGRFVNQRVAVAPIEGNAIAVVPPTSAEPRWTAYVATQMPHHVREDACALLALDPGDLRVIAPHVGGAFGGKAGVSVEHAITLAAARRLGRPLTWIEGRGESLVACGTPAGRSSGPSSAYGGTGPSPGSAAACSATAAPMAGSAERSSRADLPDARRRLPDPRPRRRRRHRRHQHHTHGRRPGRRPSRGGRADRAS
ncbi:MAG TPA: molybdopterin cofactor-binding domain-containing protein, partial [Acidimicrobiales bacterium]|nr:molybdopterin cofactor-binding domain-containing protein [Acidimicrobiales bacterium]